MKTDLEIVSIISNSAKKLGACNLIDSATNLESLTKLIFTPQGMEFCYNHKFPSLQTLRNFKDKVREFSYYIDEKVTLTDPQNIVIAGDSFAELNFSDNTKVHKIILMHGANANIKANNYTVLRIVKIGNCNISIVTDKTAIIL